MPRKYTILINKQEFPDRATVQAAIRSLGYKLTLEEDYVLFAAPKYLPCTLQGEDAGFTFSTSENSETGKGITINLQWGGDPREKAAAHIVATALAQATGSVVHDCNGNLASKESLAAETRKVLEGLEEYL